MLIPFILISWLVACALGVFCTWMLNAKAAGFVCGFVLVGFFWLMVWLYHDQTLVSPFIVP
ncbi:hypothetical protein CTA21_16435 [Salmonella enterica]|nr:hypothetical protein [Salmonella enterica]